MSTDSDIASAAAQAAAASASTAGSAATSAALALSQTRVLSEIDTTDDVVSLLVRPGPEGSQTKAALASAVTAPGAFSSALSASVGAQVNALVNETVTRATVASGTYTADPIVTDTLILTLEGDATLAFPETGWVDGQSMLIRVFQNSVGGHTLTIPNVSGFGSVTLDETAGTFETLVFQYLTGVGLVVHQAPGGPFNAPPPPSLLPTDLSALVWFDAAALTDSLADGGNVTTWADLSGNSRTATHQAGTTRTLAHNANALGIPGIRYDGTSGLLRPSTWTPSVLDGGLAIGCLFYMQSNGGVNQFLLGSTNSAPNVRGELYKHSGGSLTAYGQTSVAQSGSLTFDTVHYAVAQFREGQTTKVYLDGVQVADGTTGTLPSGSSIALGSAYPSPGATPLKGWLMTAFMIPKVLTSDEQYGLRAGISARYNDVLAGTL